jgi:hypothetical protein
MKNHVAINVCTQTRNELDSCRLQNWIGKPPFRFRQLFKCGVNDSRRYGGLLLVVVMCEN